MTKHQEYRGRNRDKRTVVDSPFVPVHTCPACGKQAYVSKADAKQRAKRLHQGQKVRVHSCRYKDGAEESWHITTMGAWATMRYKDYEANGRQPYAEWKEEDNG